MNPVPNLLRARCWRNAWPAAIVALTMTACGGGSTDTPPVITLAPVSSVGAAGGGAVTFAVTATGSGLVFQWQSSTDQGATWADVAGATAAQYVIQSVDWVLNGNRYRVRISGAGVVVTSDPVTLTVACAPLALRLDGKALYDACLNVTYLTNANLPATLPLGVSGIEADGTMNWPTAKAWVQALNASAYLGHADWRLPVVRPQNGTAMQLNGTELQTHTGQIDLGHNISAQGTRYAGSKVSELPFLFFNQLGGLAEYTIDGAPRTGLSNAALPFFTNISQSSAYWTSTPYGSTGAFAFDFRFGTQYAYVANDWRFSVLVLRDGDVDGGSGGGGTVADACQPPWALPAGTTVEADTALGALVTTAKLSVVGPATFEGHAVTEVDTETPFANLSVRAFGVWDGTAHELTGHGVLTRAASADGTAVQNVKAVATPPAVDRRYALAPGASFTLTASDVQTETLTLSGVPQPPTTRTETTTTTVQFVGMETVTVPAGTFHACKYIETANTGTTTAWVMAGYGIPLKTVTAGSTSVVNAVRVNGQALSRFP